MKKPKKNTPAVQKKKIGYTAKQRTGKVSRRIGT